MEGGWEGGVKGSGLKTNERQCEGLHSSHGAKKPRNVYTFKKIATLLGQANIYSCLLTARASLSLLRSYQSHHRAI